MSADYNQRAAKRGHIREMWSRRPLAGWVKSAANKVLSRRLERKRLQRETLALKGDSHEDRPWRLSDQHQTLLRLMLEEPTPKVSAAFKEQLAAYVKGDSHE